MGRPLNGTCTKMLAKIPQACDKVATKRFPLAEHCNRHQELNVQHEMRVHGRPTKAPFIKTLREKQSPITQQS